jgi:gluconolactonase
MPQQNLASVVAFSALLLCACSSSGGDDPGGSAAGAGLGGGGGGGGGNPSGAAGQSGGTVGQNGGAAGQNGAAAGQAPTAGSGGQGGAVQTGGAGSGAGGGASGGAGGAGGGGPVTPGKGPSGKAVCAGLSGFVDPTTSIGSVAEIKAPQSSFFAFIEGPVWVASSKLLFFSDNAGSPERIWQYDPSSMAVTKVLEGSGSNGLGVDAQDQLLAANQVDHALYRLDPATKMKVGANFAVGSYKPNDLIARSDGGIYVSDPDTGVWFVAAGGGEPKLATKSVNRPNGLVLSLDESTLIVGDVGNQSITKFPLAADGSLMDAPTPFGKTTGTTADGMCMDCAGNVYVSTQTGVEIFDPAGKSLGTVPTGEASNCTFGGEDRKTLFVTSRAVLKVIKMPNPGLPD